MICGVWVRVAVKCATYPSDIHDLDRCQLPCLNMATLVTGGKERETKNVRFKLSNQGNAARRRVYIFLKHKSTRQRDVSQVTQSSSTNVSISEQLIY